MPASDRDCVNCKCLIFVFELVQVKAITSTPTFSFVEPVKPFVPLIAISVLCQTSSQF